MSVAMLMAEMAICPGFYIYNNLIWVRLQVKFNARTWVSKMLSPFAIIKGE
ncbi:hypothetical protein RchiOBHm_Chr5g0071141 [Rosa chinensis]|uniref:Uncharacterized protein n=1 Tax=Rosa chinensis TaxID=74649 RepID=A0A2P6QKC6_ROSCH|nr:hypothetical protein RchiOBHm_Chr5g0071141 [Rosa chinensis]